MNFLPFVFTFLLLLTMVSSFLFSSAIGTAREGRVILEHHESYHALLSKQNEKTFKSKKGKYKAGDKKPLKKRDKTPQAGDREPRSCLDGCDGSKLNLYAMIHGIDPDIKHVLEQSAIRLIESLYHGYPFYNSAQTKDIAHTLVKQMIRQEANSLEEVKFDDRQLQLIYYKMLKGTNTGYPSLLEYVSLNPKTDSIYFQYASKPVLKGVLGERFAEKVFALEKKQWEKNKYCKALVKDKFMELVTTEHTSLVPFNLIKPIFNFKKDKKGVVQIYKTAKIRAKHKNPSYTKSGTQMPI